MFFDSFLDCETLYKCSLIPITKHKTIATVIEKKKTIIRILSRIYTDYSIISECFRKWRAEMYHAGIVISRGTLNNYLTLLISVSLKAK